MNKEQQNGSLDFTLLMKKVDVEWIKAIDCDLGHEMWESVEFLLHCAPVEFGLPVFGEALDILSNSKSVRASGGGASESSLARQWCMV